MIIATPSEIENIDLKKLVFLNKIMTAGEPLTKQVFSKIRNNYSEIIYNGYGPTETTVHTLNYTYNKNENEHTKLIGKPLIQTKVFVLNKDKKLVPINAIGELYITGECVGRGYLNRPELNNEKFISNPFQTEQEKNERRNTKMYKTGDLVRILPDGNIEYINRNDTQVKIRGLRIELSEIENVLSSYECIEKGVILVKEDKVTSIKYLVGYYVSKITYDETNIKVYMQSKLPLYMIPNRIIKVEKIPLTFNGKLDANALPNVEIKNNGAEFESPRNNIEAKLCQIWCDLLGIKDIGINDDFFHLGADSIICLQLVGMIRHNLGLQIKVKDILKHKTIKNIHDNILKDQSNEKKMDDEKFLRDKEIYLKKNREYLSKIAFAENVESIYLANSLQQGLFYHYLKQGEFDDCNIVRRLIQYDTNIDKELYETAWKNAQIKYPSLRLRFESHEDIVQIVDKKQYLAFKYIDLSNILIENEQEMRIEQIEIDDKNEKYKLHNGQLFRIYLIKQNNNLFKALLSIHHIILDGWSYSILLDYVHETYLNLKEKLNIVIDKDTVYEDSQIYLQMHLNSSLEYWQNELNKIYERPDLSSLLKLEVKDKIVLSEYDYIKEPKDRYMYISGEKFSKLKFISKEYGITVNSIMQFVWHKVLSLYGNSSQTVVGIMTSGRNLPIDRIENSVGLYINTLPLLIEHNNNLTILESLKEIQNKINELITNSNINLSQIQKSHFKHGIFDSMLIYENHPEEKDFDQLGSQHIKYFEKMDYPFLVTCFDLIKLNQILFLIEYAEEIISEEVIEDIVLLTEHILEQITTNINKKIDEIDFIPENQKAKINSFNEQSMQNITFEEKDTTLNLVFEEIASRNANKIAVVYKKIKLTYKELNEKANQLAHYLTSLISIKADDVIALLLDKSELMIISILAVWKTGAAYVPIDPNFPNERIQSMLKDTNAKIIVYNSDYYELVKSFSMVKININDSCKQIFNNTMIENKQNLINNASPNSLAYIIYTSGTTGKPKGVLIEHKNVVSLKNAYYLTFFLNSTQQDSILFSSNYVFDASISQILMSLFCGNSLILIKNILEFDDNIYEFLNDNKLTMIIATPSEIENIDLKKLVFLNKIMTTGEPLTKQVFSKIRNNYNEVIYNGYGRTETTVHTLNHTYNKNENEHTKLIGKPLIQTKVFVLNKDKKPIPINAIGELYITGECVGRGYLNRPELNNEKFILNPFQTEQEKNEGRNTKMYKTGDLVRILPDGNIEYINRNDTQVKIRGLRIELSEIENVLSSYECIEKGVILVKEDKVTSIKYLVGYYVSKITYDETNIKVYMQSKLPLYMIPNRIIKVEKIPLTFNGKLDANALPNVEIKNNGAEFESPRNNIEAKLRQIWCDLLGIKDIGINDDLFLLGCDSSILVKFVFLMKRELNCFVSIKDIFVFKTIKNIYDNVFFSNNQSLPDGNIVRKSVDEESNNLPNQLIDLLPIQKWFFSKFKEPFVHYFNQAFLIKTHMLNEVKLMESLNKLIKHHESFRIRFKKISDNNYLEYYSDSLIDERIHLNKIDLKDFKNEDNTLDERKLNIFLTSLQRKFNIEKGPLFSICYLTGFDDDSARIWFGIHHLIIDAVSWRIICEDLMRLYEGFELSDLSVKYSEWTNLIKNYKQFCLNTEESYWKSIANDLIIFNKNITINYQLNNYCIDKEITFDENQTAIFLKECTFLYDSQINALLLTALGFSVEILSKSETNYITLEGHGREELEYDNEGNILDISRTVGWFTSMHPVRIKINKRSLKQSIKNVRRELLSVPHKGIGYGPIIGYKDNCLAHVSFNYLGQLDSINKTNNKWHLTEGIIGNVMRYEDNNIITDHISINGHCLDGKLKFLITSKYNKETTETFANVFKMKIEQIINERNDANAC